MDEYSILKTRIQAAGLLEAQPGYYIMKFAVAFGLLAASVLVFVFVDTFWIQLLNAVFLAFVFTQFGFLGHDTGHYQVSKRKLLTTLIGFPINFVLCLSRSWWVTEHNIHHANPNILEEDPHTFIPLIAFTKKQALEQRGIGRFLVRYQAFYFPLMLFLQGLGSRLASALFLLKRGEEAKHRVIEGFLMLAHAVVYFGLLFWFLEFWQVVVFFIVHQGIFGFYSGSVFAPNHKGMPVFEKDNNLGYVRLQVLTARNVRNSPITDFLYGGLNYQIEHHLFPNMPRNNLHKAKPIVKAFCEEMGISYYETGFLQSVKEILGSLHEASEPLRRVPVSQ